MAWLILGAFLLFVAGGASLERSRHVDAVSIAALAGLAGALLQSFHVYSAQNTILCFAAALAGALALRSILSSTRRLLRLLALSAGALSCLFALFGPAEGLF